MFKNALFYTKIKGRFQLYVLEKYHQFVYLF
jgi:hypothetical protein